ncbi:hypothetical protein V6N13_118366 [Hibiscus sabdariffa]
MQIASLGKAMRQGGSSITFVQDEYVFRIVLDEFWMVFGVFAAQISAFLVLGIGTSMVVSVPIPLWNPSTDAALLVPVPLAFGIGT